jgi:NADPH:quinone reductase-like Zn-dependent oxidoreductase
VLLSYNGKNKRANMKASIRRKYGSPDQIKIDIVETPIPKDNEVLIKVYATTVNRTDCANLTAKPFIMRFVLGLFKPRQIILGTDFAGEIVSIGKDIKSFSIGSKVFGFNDIGAASQAEYLTTTLQQAENDTLYY